MVFDFSAVQSGGFDFSSVSPSTPVSTTPSTNEEVLAMERKAAKKGQVYVEPVSGFSAEATAGLYAFAERASMVPRGIAQLLGIDKGEVEKSVLKREALERNPEYATGAQVGTLAGYVAEPTTYALPFAKAKTLSEFIKQSAVIGGVSGFFGAASEDTSRGKEAAIGTAAGGVGGAVLGTVVRAGGKLFGKDWLPWKATPEEKKVLHETLKKESPKIPEEELNHFLNAPEDAHINAKKIAEDLIEKGASKKEAEKVIEKRPLVSHYLEEYRTRYEAIKSSSLGITKQGEVLPPEVTPGVGAPVSPEAPRIEEKPLGIEGEPPGLPEQPPTLPNQGGYVSPQLAADIAGAGLGAIITPDDPLTGAVVGAAVAHGGGRLASRIAEANAQSSVAKATKEGLDTALERLDYATGLPMTTLSNINRELGHRHMEFERAYAMKRHNDTTKVSQFLHDIAQTESPTLGQKIKSGLGFTKPSVLTKEEAAEVNRALTSNDFDAVTTILSKPGVEPLLKGFQEIKSVFNQLGKEAVEVGVLKPGQLRTDYFPRGVKDREGLLNYLGKDMGSVLSEKINKASKKKIADTGLPLTPEEEATIVEKAISASFFGKTKPSFVKGRTLEEVTEDMKQFYFNPAETASTYIDRMAQSIEAAKYLGKSKVMTDGQLNVEESISKFINDKVKSGEIADKDVDKVVAVLRSRFLPPKGAPEWGILEAGRNLTVAGTMGNIVSAAAQIGDPFITAHLYGIRPTLKAIVQKVTGTLPVNREKFGLTDYITEELTNTSKTARLMRRTLKTGLTQLDNIFKDVTIGATLNQGHTLASSEKGIAKLKEMYGPEFGDRFPQLVSDLKNENFQSDVASEYIWAQLVKQHPVTQMHRPRLVQDYPMLRSGFTLHSYQLMMADIVRRQSYNKIKEGGIANIAEGVKNLAGFSAALTAGGATGAQVQSWMLGRDDIELSDAVDNALRTFGLSSYAMKKLEQGSPIQAVGSQVTAPFAVAEGLVHKDPKTGEWELNQNRLMKLMPGVGRIVESRTMGGAEKFKERQLKEKMIDMSPTEKRLTKLSPEYQKALTKKRLEARQEKLKESLRRRMGETNG